MTFDQQYASLFGCHKTRREPKISGTLRYKKCHQKNVVVVVVVVVAVAVAAVVVVVVVVVALVS